MVGSASASRAGIPAERKTSEATHPAPDWLAPRRAGTERPAQPSVLTCFYCGSHNVRSGPSACGDTFWLCLDDSTHYGWIA